jgi:hypothetical protein
MGLLSYGQCDKLANGQLREHRTGGAGWNEGRGEKKRS